MIRETIRVAMLKPHMAAQYEAIHTDYPAVRRSRMVEAGYGRLDIYRHGLVLFMIVHHDDDFPVDMADSEFDQQWRDLTEPCFATKWEDLKRIFAFNSCGQGER